MISHLVPANFSFLIDFSHVASPACERYSNQMFKNSPLEDLTSPNLYLITWFLWGLCLRNGQDRRAKRSLVGHALCIAAPDSGRGRARDVFTGRSIYPELSALFEHRLLRLEGFSSRVHRA